MRVIPMILKKKAADIDARPGNEIIVEIIVAEIFRQVAAEIDVDDCADKAITEIVNEYRYFAKVLLGVEVISFLFYLGEIVMAWIMARTMKD